MGWPLVRGLDFSSPPAVPAAAEAELQQAPIASAKSSSSGSAEYIYGYDKEHEVAWRLASRLGATKEFAPVTSSADKDDSQHPVAVFDGQPVEIKTVTMRELKQNADMFANRRGRLWTEGALYIRYTKDRSPLLLLFEERAGEHDKQICQIHVRHFGDPTNQVRPNKGATRFASMFYRPGSCALAEPPFLRCHNSMLTSNCETTP